MSLAEAAITATDDELRAYLAEAEVPPLLPALAYVTGDLSLLRDDLRPDPNLLALPQGGMSAAQQAERAGARARGAHPVPRRRLPSRAPAVARRAVAHHGVRGRRLRHGRLRPAARRGARAPRRRPTGPPVAEGRCRSRPRLPGRRDRRRDVGPARRVPVAAGGHRVPGGREEPRRRRHLVREHLSGVPGRQPQPQLQLLVRAAPRLAPALLRTRKSSTATSATARATSGSSTTSASGPRSARRPGTKTSATWSVVVQASDGAEETLVANAVVSAVGQLNRPHFPEIPGHRHLRGRVVPLRAVGPRRADRRRARRGDRHRRQLGAVHPGDRAARRSPVPVPAHATVARPEPRLPRGRARRAAVALRPRPHLQRVEPLLDVLAPGRRIASRACGWIPSGTTPTARVNAINDMMRRLLTSYLEQQFADRPDLLPHVDPHLPAGREAVAARQRGVGRRTDARQRHARRPTRSARSRPPAS